MTKMLNKRKRSQAHRLNRELGIVLLAVLLVSPVCQSLNASDKPNIVIILGDDIGFSDIGCYGSEINTPNLDALAKNGIRFTQFYNTARCCPTRASLLTGLYPHQAGVGHMMEDRGHNGYRGDLNRNCMTIAEVLSPTGYRCYAAGKWHVTKAIRPKEESEKSNWPLQRGFDRFYGTIHGAGSFFDPKSLTRDNSPISPFADPEYPAQDYYYTDAISDHASRFIREHNSNTPDQPFLLYVAYTAAHWPMHARENDIAKYKGKYDAGYQAIRDARYHRMIERGVISSDNTVNWQLPAQLGEEKFFEWDCRNMEVYAAMIDSMDQGIGRLMATLHQTGQLENTLICYMQDNGGCAEGIGRGNQGTERLSKPTLTPLANDYIQHDAPPKQTRDGYPVRQGKGVMAGPADTYIAYGEAWATVSNTPFRKHKHWVHEGGISTPLIVHWPKGIAPQVDSTHNGKLVHEPCHLIDIMATAVDVSKADYPKEKDDQKVKPLEGRSLSPFFSNQKPVAFERYLYWEHEGNRAVRHGDWKLVAESNKPWELYNIAKDRSEQNNLASEHPEKVAGMAAAWDAYAERANVLPLGAWNAKNKN
jgi:arylsulfatase A-like enzyme